MAQPNRGTNATINTSLIDYMETMSQDTEGTLKSIDLILKQITKEDGILISQSSLQDMVADANQPGAKAQAKQSQQSRSTAAKKRGPNASRDDDWFDSNYAKKKFRKASDSFTDQLEAGFKEGLFGSKNVMRDALSKSVSGFAKSLGTDVDHLGQEVGRRLGDEFGRTKWGQSWRKAKDEFSSKATSAVDDLLNKASSALGGTGDINVSMDDLMEAGGAAEGAQAATEAAGAFSEVTDIVTTAGSNVGGALSTLVKSIGSGGASGLVGSLGSLASAGLAAAGPLIALEVGTELLKRGFERLKEAIGPAAEGFQAFKKAASSAANYQTNKAAKLMDLEKARIESDARAITEAAFKVIEDSAEKVETTWDNVFATVVTSQGYTKAGVQDLWSSYAQRLKDEGLASVISSADIMESLESVLKQGLSGQVAEEFAYQATLLGNAISNEDFFAYASTYASLAANAIKNGASEEEAIAAANAELQSFASNLLYAKREIAGGFSTSLAHGADLFEQSAKIALTSRTGDLSDISGVLTSVSAIVGAIAPDLVNNVVDSVVSAATGGNDSTITALRSLAGVGASNSAFLQAFAKDPKKIFSTLFSNLAQLQNMSADNYMEVAEALSSTFGLSMDAFARVDFEYLAEAIQSMNLNNESLEQNLQLLTDGQTTSTDAQLRMQKINEYMVDQGLAYVLDNQVARSIQEHMWEEQLAQQIMETNFAVDLTGGALQLFNGIAITIQKIADLVNPLAWVKKAGNLFLQAVEASQLDNRVENLLKSTVVGQGTFTEFHNLTTTGTELGIAGKDSYLNWLGTSGKSLAGKLASFNLLSAYTNLSNTLSITNWGNLAGQVAGVVAKADDTLNSLLPSAKANSYYTHKLISKGAASTLKSGNWRDNLSYNALYDNFDESGTKDEEGARTQKQAEKLSNDLKESISKYVQSSADSSSSLDNLKSTVSDLSLLVASSTNPLIQRDIDELQESLKNKDLTKGAEAGLAHRSYYTQSELTEKVAKELAEQANSQANSFDDWLAKFERESGIKNLSAELSMYSETLEAVEEMYNAEQTAQSSAAAKARELHEVQFWEDMQHFATVDFPWYMREWERYYIQHEAYGKATQEAQESAIELKDMQQNEFGDAIFKLAEQLVQNSNWQEEMAKELKDPAVQTNALLAQLVLLVDAIRQQNNETSIVSVPTALSSLGLGLSKSKV